MRIALLVLLGLTSPLVAQRKKDAAPWITLALPDGMAIVTDTSDAFLKPTGTLKVGVAAARSGIVAR